MSGPKVIRIVTPAEIARYEGQRDRLLQRLREVIEEWAKALDSLGMLTFEKQNDVEERFKTLRATFFPEFSKSVEKTHFEMQFLKSDILQARIEYEAARKSKRRKLEVSARAIADEFTRSGKKAPAELLDAIKKVAKSNDAEFADLQRIVSNSVSSVFDLKQETAQKSEPSELARALAEGLPELTKIHTVLGKIAPKPVEAKNDRLDKLFAELNLLDESVETQQFVERAKKIEVEKSESKRELLIDSLILDLSTHCKALREQNTLLARLEQAKLELTESSFENETLYSEIEKAIAERTTAKQAEVLIGKVSEFIAKESARAAASEKRQAILKSFAALGYDVKQGMETYWAENGKLVLAKKTSPGIGVEIASAGTMERLQMRAVEIAQNAAGKQAKVDASLENSWCGDLDKLKQSLNELGQQFVIEQALPAGKVPVKICEAINWNVAEQEEEEVQERQERKLKSRTLS